MGHVKEFSGEEAACGSGHGRDTQSPDSLLQRKKRLKKSPQAVETRAGLEQFVRAAVHVVVRP
jgi:hypothetical protein